MAESGIYEIVNLVNGKRYVGSALKFTARWHKQRCELRKQRHHSKHLQNAWNKYGEHAFEFRVIEECARDTLLEREQFHINQGCDYNKCLRAGSPLGVKHTAAAKAKMGAASRRSWQKRQAEGRAEMSDQHKANLSRARRELFASGYKAPERTEEQRKKYSAASRRKWEDPELRQKTCSSIKASYTPELRELRGRLSRERWSDPEYREAMSEKTRQAHKEGRMPDLGTMSRLRWEDPAYREKMLSMLRDRAPPTEETREKLRQANLGKKHSLETRRKRSALTDEVAAEILHLRVAGKQHREIAHITGVSLVTVTRICHRERYQWVEPQIPLEALKYRHRGVKWQTLLESRRSHGP